jgi:hypothetical protein
MILGIQELIILALAGGGILALVIFLVARKR